MRKRRAFTTLVAVLTSLVLAPLARSEPRAFCRGRWRARLAAHANRPALVMDNPWPAPVKQGDRFPLTLKFENAPPLTVTVTVEAIGAHAH